MALTEQEKRESARRFIQRWNGKGYEKGETQAFWIELLQDVLGFTDVTKKLVFEKQVEIGSKDTKFIDVYIPETKVLIEQKGVNIDLDKIQPAHKNKTPYEQAFEYNTHLTVDEKARWIITSNFKEIRIYDMSKSERERYPVIIMLSDLQSKYPNLELLLDKEVKVRNEEVEISKEAGILVGKLYDKLYAAYVNPDDDTLKSLNVLCVRLVFCLYAEDAGVFGKKNMFSNYLREIDSKRMRNVLKDLFRMLNTKEEDRDADDDPELLQFPYVNGGLFADENIKIPQFDEEMKTELVDSAANFDWSNISPTIFGAVFESTLNPETRRKGGMHYTSIENIHKVIDPLFLDELKEEYNIIMNDVVIKNRASKLRTFQDKLASLKWLDPACGSGNFLTETYLSIRRLENRVIYELEASEKGAIAGQISVFEQKNPIKVSIQQFYGIEINDFAVTVAKTALWIAESQMMKETEDIVMNHLDFLPLTTNAFILEKNALDFDWNELVPKSSLSYIMGNPPFVGFYLQDDKQKLEVRKLTQNSSLDYVSCWFVKAAEYIQNTRICAAFVSTNSITQGEQVGLLWDILLNSLNMEIYYAYETFIWESEANDKAHVHCVIIGFSHKGNIKKKYIYGKTENRLVSNISPYIYDGETILVKSRRTPICNIPELILGNRPLDGQNLLLSEEEYEEIVNQEPEAKRWIRPFLGATEFINNKKRYCLWLVGISPNQLNSLKLVKQRVMNCREARLNAKDKQMRNLADSPTLFREQKTSSSDFVVLPRVSSSRRRYMPIGYIDGNTIAGDALQMIIDSNKYHFGILTSNVHNAWMRTVAGRLKSDYRYGKETVYNTFPWPSPTEEQKNLIERTAQEILDARKLFPDSSLADLYDPLTMPMELQKAHLQNDKAVMQAYGFDVKSMSEADCVAELMKMYQMLTEN